MAEEKQEDKAYEVKDKRRVNADGTLKEDAETPSEEPTQEQSPEEQPAEQAPAEERPEATGPAAEMPAPDIYETLQFVTGLLIEQAWQFMGLHLPPGRKEPVKDMVQAKIAIDTVIFVADRLHPHLNEEERRTIRGIISDLQLNFVQHGQ